MMTEFEEMKRNADGFEDSYMDTVNAIVLYSFLLFQADFIVISFPSTFIQVQVKYVFLIWWRE